MEVKEAYHDTVAEGFVIASSVEKDAVLYKGQKIVLTVSRGKEAKMNIMPNLLRDSIDKVKAESMLAVREFENVTWIAVDSVLPEGRIVSQSVEAGAEIDVTTPIIIEYSNGIRPVVTIEYTFADLPLMEESYVITIMQGEEVVVQLETIQPGQTTFTVSLTGRDPTEYTIYVNYNYYKTVTVIFS